MSIIIKLRLRKKETFDDLGFEVSLKGNQREREREGKKEKEKERKMKEMPIKFNEGDLFNYRYVPFFERLQMERK